MIEKQIAEYLSLQYEKRLLIFDTGDFCAAYDYTRLLKTQHYEVIQYIDIEAFRLLYEQEIKKADTKWAIIVSSDIYVPYDIRKRFFEIELSIRTLFPKLNEDIVRKYIKDIDLISFAYGELYSPCENKEKAERFIVETVFSKQNVTEYCTTIIDSLLPSGELSAIKSCEWIDIARKKALLEFYAAKANVSISTSFVDVAFEKFVFDGYQKLSGQTNSLAPAILPKVIDFIAHGKTALIVMDGMSLFDFEIISRHLDGIDFDFQCTYALIPTTTPISRQGLLSGKYPRQLENPFSLSKEEKGFLEAAANARYTRRQSLYTKGYEPPIGKFTKFAAIIINDVDDIVHGQKQGRRGMYNDITLMAQEGKLQALIKDLTVKGFTVYITSDHGNTPCIGVGAIRNVGVEVETKSKRMFVLKDFAEEKDYFADKVLTYPGYYLNKDYNYYVCEAGVSFDNKNDEVMTHGGISIDEVIVPFITIKAVD
ncbi:PglZ domain-containing protein [Dehalobacter sp.]|uniref:PglZ domain-containing protein n=1 Tax=Dehalobacter sp. TaxID=1962289 RepID=UPI00258C4ABC|nr:PglZ domain-containing protein [Dehalobacter sp.]MDJ0306797.1 PglZ domain-containing protein [Dehalobacter sp.]